MLPDQEFHHASPFGLDKISIMIVKSNNIDIICRSVSTAMESGMRQSSYLKDMIAILFERRFTPPGVSSGRPVVALCRLLLSETGDIATIKIAREILGRYARMDAAGKLAFFEFLARDLDLDSGAIVLLATEYGESPTTRGFARLVKAAEPGRQELLRRLNRVVGATPLLVAMRRDLLALIDAHPDLARIDLDFAHLLSSWFNPGFLVLKRISWHTPANILDKIIEYEAVHAIRDWDDLRRRLQPEDRRCFAYFHPSMPDEPLIFVEVALCKGIPGSIQAVLADGRSIVAQDGVDTAVFYSISNCQEGLRGVSFGNSLIKQVVEDLSNEIPHLTQFITLSPMPGLARWLEEQGLSEPPSGERLRILAAQYLIEGKRPDGAPRDSVARFHLGNGATVHDIHTDADLSENGMRQSCGAMVNYLYDLKGLELNIEAYFGGKRIATSRRMQAILKNAHRAARKG